MEIVSYVVEGGLETGDRIALRDPSETATRVFAGEAKPTDTGESTP